MRSGRGGRSLLVFAALIIATGCGAFLNLSDEDDPHPVSPSPDSGGESSSSSSGSTSSGGDPSLPPPDPDGDGDGGTFEPDAKPDEDVKIGNFGLRVATFEDQALISPTTGMDQQVGFEVLKLPGGAPALLGEYSARTAATNDSRIWYVLSTPQSEVDFSFIFIANALPQTNVRLMHVGTEAPPPNTIGVDLSLDNTGGLHFTASGNTTTDFAAGKVQAGGMKRVFLRLSRMRGDARIAVTDADKQPAQLTLLSWPTNAPISVAVVGRVANPSMMPQGSFAFDQVRLGPPGTILPK